MRLERASKDAKLYATRRARLSVLSSEAGRHVFRTETCRSDKSERPEPRCLQRYRRAYGRYGCPKAENAEIRMRVQPRCKSKFFRPHVGSRLWRTVSFCSKILPINFDHYFLIFPDTSKRGQWDNPRNPRDDVTCKYLLFVGRF